MADELRVAVGSPALSAEIGAAPVDTDVGLAVGDARGEMRVAIQQSSQQVGAAVLPAAQGINVLVPFATGSIADAAKRLKTPRRIALEGDAQGGTLFDGSEDVSVYTEICTLSNEELEAILK